MKIEEILADADAHRASDIHMQPGSPVMFRISGRLESHGAEQVAAEEVEELAKELLGSSQWQELEQTGETDTAVSLEGARMRVSFYRQQGTYAASFRILSSAIPEPKELNIPDSVLNLTKENKGLVLITGEAGSGRSTTVASLLHQIAVRDTRHIITIENPVEYLISGGQSLVSQREIGSDTGSYAKAVRAALRQDPDVIFIGELSDVDTVKEAIAAAESGHLVFSTLHTNRTEDTLHRLIDIFPEYARTQIRVQLAEVLRGVIARQLIPRCDSGERVAVFEIMLANKELRELLRENRLSGIRDLLESGAEGMQTMDASILQAYMKSQVSADTAVAYAADPETMKRKIRIY